MREELVAPRDSKKANTGRDRLGRRPNLMSFNFSSTDGTGNQRIRVQQPFPIVQGIDDDKHDRIIIMLFVADNVGASNIYYMYCKTTIMCNDK